MGYIYKFKNYKSLNDIRKDEDYILEIEKIKDDKNSERDKLKDLRLGGLIHRKIRDNIINYLIKDDDELYEMMSYKNNKREGKNVRLYDLCNRIENMINNELRIDNININKGVAFPVGLSINNIVAHDSSYNGDDRILKYDDIIKIDYGIHINGHIIDSAFTFSYSDKYNDLIESTKEATLNAIKYSGIDTAIEDITDIIEETIKSYDIELNKKIYDINPVQGLGGHNILPYEIHGGKIILSHKDYPENLKNLRMRENELYAIETFATNSDGIIKQSTNIITHYMLNKNYLKNSFKFTFNATKDCYDWIIKKRKTLPFSIKWIHDDLYKKIGNKYKFGIKELLEKNIINGYPAIETEIGSFSSQDEKTIYIHEYGKEILS